jgi:RHS repeat-associated protein
MQNRRAEMSSKKYRYLCAAFLGVFMCIAAGIAASAANTTYNADLYEAMQYSQSIVPDKQTAPVSIDESGTATVNPASGNLEYEHTDLYLKGKGGLDVSLTRKLSTQSTYDSGDVYSIGKVLSISDQKESVKYIYKYYVDDTSDYVYIYYDSEEQMLLAENGRGEINAAGNYLLNVSPYVPGDKSDLEHHGDYYSNITGDFAEDIKSKGFIKNYDIPFGSAHVLKREQNARANEVKYASIQAHGFSQANLTPYLRRIGYGWYYNDARLERMGRYTDYSASSTNQNRYIEYGHILLKDGTILPYEAAYTYNQSHSKYEQQSANIVVNSNKIYSSMYKLYIDYPRASIEDDKIDELGFAYEMRIEDYTGRTMYFGSNGSLVAETDRYGNKIIYTNNSIIDTYDRTIHFPVNNQGGSITVDGVPVATYSFDIQNNAAADKNNYLTADDTNILTVTYPGGAKYSYTTKRHDNLCRLSRNPDTDSTEKAYNSDINFISNTYTLDKITLPTGAYKMFLYDRTNAYAQGKGHTYERMKVSREYDVTVNGQRINDCYYTYNANPTEGLINGGSDYTTQTQKYSTVSGQSVYITDTYDSKGTLLNRNDNKNETRTYTEYEYAEMPEGNKKISKEKVTSYAGNNSSAEQTTLYTYNNQQQLASKTIGSYKETYEYGAYGLMKQSEVTKGTGDLAKKSVRTVYKIVDKNISEKRIYDVSLGRPEYKDQVKYDSYYYNQYGDKTYDYSSSTWYEYQYLNTSDAVNNPEKNLMIVTTKTSAKGIVDENGNDITGWLVTGQTVYNLFGNIVSQTDAKGNKTTYEYDGRQRMIKQTTPDGSTQTNEYFDKENQIIKTDENGNKTKLCYDSVGRYIGGYALDEDTGSWILAETLTYDDIGNVTKLVSSRDAAGSQKVSVDYAYFGDGTKKSETVVNGLTGQLLSKYKIASRNYRLPSNSNSLSEKNLVIVGEYYIDDSHYTETKKEYDMFGNLSYEFLFGSTVGTGYVSQETKYSYDYLGNLLSETDPNGNVTTYTYNALGNVLTVKNAAGDTANNVYDTSRGLLESETDYNGNTTTYLYNSFNQVQQVTTPMGGITKTYYDANGNQAKVSVLREGSTYDTTRYLYDSRNRLTAVIGTGGTSKAVTQYAYDKAGNQTKLVTGLTAVTNMNTLTKSNSQMTEYKYNYLNQCVETIDPMGQSETAEYDLFGNPLQKTDRNGDITTYQYTPLGQLSKVYAAKDNTEISYTYDKLGNRTSMTDETGTTNYIYDGLSRLTKVTDGDGMARTYEYDANGNVTRMNMLVNGTQKFYDSYTYNSLNLVEKMTNSNSSHTIRYDKNGNLTYYSYGDKRTNYTYNKDNALISADIAGNKESYSYYLNGNRMSTTAGGKTTTYHYDGLGRLTTESTGGGQCITYNYDSGGNRIKKSVSGVANPTQTSYTYDKNNRLTKEEIHGKSDDYVINSYYYDPNGNQTYKNIESYIKPERLETRLQIKADGNGTSYSYDGLNRLKEVKNSATTASYTYNGDNLRQTKTVNGVTTRHVYNGQNVIYEEMNGAPKAAYHRLGDRIISSRVYSGETSYTYYYYAYNGQGNISQILAGSRVAVDYTYDAFGYKSANINEDVYNPFRYNGEYYDEETGYTYLRNRYYDSDKGRFINEDPIKSGLNWYTYCENNPVMFIDPLGLEPTEAEEVYILLTKLLQRKLDYNIYAKVYGGKDTQAHKDAKELRKQIVNSEFLQSNTELKQFFQDVLYRNGDDNGGASFEDTNALMRLLNYYLTEKDENTRRSASSRTDLSYGSLYNAYSVLRKDINNNKIYYKYESWDLNSKMSQHFLETWFGVDLIKTQITEQGYKYNRKEAIRVQVKIDEQEERQIAPDSI